MDRTRFVSRIVFDGWREENFSDCAGKGKDGTDEKLFRWHVRFIGISEMLGALGLILPLVTGILPWLTVLAAIGLTVIQVLAIFTVHLPRKEFNALPMNALLLTLSAFITFGRWELFV